MMRNRSSRHTAFSPRTRNAGHAAALLGVLASAMVFSGCRGKNSETSEHAATPEIGGGLDPRTPMIAGNPAGLEIIALLVQRPASTFQGVLDAYQANEAALDGPAEPAWMMQELRAERVALDRLPSFMGELASNAPDALADGESTAARSIGGARQWVGQSPSWQEIARGSLYPHGLTLALAGERVELPPGQLRLLARAWVVPVPADEDEGTSGAKAALHVELSIQHRPRRTGENERLDLALSSPSEKTLPSGDGIMLTSLSATLTLGMNEAIVIAPIEPVRTIDTAETAAAETTDENAAGGAGIGIGRVSRAEESPSGRGSPATAYGPGEAEPATREGAGPPAPSLPTVGRALLGEEARGTGVRARRRQVIVLVPRLPERFELP